MYLYIRKGLASEVVGSTETENENNSDCEEHKKRGFTPPHLGGEDEILSEMQPLIAVAEIARDDAETLDICKAEVSVFDSLVDESSDVAEVFGGHRGCSLDVFRDCVGAGAVLHCLQDELDVCEGEEEVAENLHCVICV